VSDPPVLRTIRIWADTVSKFATRCRQRSCRRPIWFAQSVGRGKMIPFDGRPIPVRTELEPGTTRTVWYLDERQIHFVTCPGARKRPAPRPIPSPPED
jgi:hypothetical protein